MSEPQIMTVDDLASFAKVSKSKIYRDAESGKLPFLRWGGKSSHGRVMWRFERAEVLAWMRGEAASRAPDGSDGLDRSWIIAEDGKAKKSVGKELNI